MPASSPQRDQGRGQGAPPGRRIGNVTLPCEGNPAGSRAVGLLSELAADAKLVVAELRAGNRPMTLDRYANLLDDDLDAVAERLHGIRESLTHSAGHRWSVIELASR